jgi:peptidoglycan/xylan/chitin deacetylase (PgdA/CDA1 family)
MKSIGQYVWIFTIATYIIVIITYSIQYGFGQITLVSNQIVNRDNPSTDTPKNAPGAPDGKNVADRYIVLNFDDSYKSQITYAKPILDKYGFKAMFFQVCDWLGSGSESNEKMTWSDIAMLKAEGHDIEAHTMTHPHLNKLTTSELEFEIGESRQCLLDHGINSTIFAYPYGEGSDNPEVSKIVSTYYEMARTNGEMPLTHLDSDNKTSGQYISSKHGNGDYMESDRFVDRYAINSWSHRHIEGDYTTSERKCEGTCIYYDSSQMLEKFIEVVESQAKYNVDGIIRAIPIVVYHTFVDYPDIRDSTRPVDVTEELFEKEMRYLHDNNIKVLLMSDLP